MPSVTHVWVKMFKTSIYKNIDLYVHSFVSSMHCIVTKKESVQVQERKEAYTQQQWYDESTCVQISKGHHDENNQETARHSVILKKQTEKEQWHIEHSGLIQDFGWVSTRIHYELLIIPTK